MYMHVTVFKNFNHGSFKKIFLDTKRGGGEEEEGFLAFFWPKFTKNVTGEGDSTYIVECIFSCKSNSEKKFLGEGQNFKIWP
jgi:hypothetical protein